MKEFVKHLASSTALPIILSIACCGHAKAETPPPKALKIVEIYNKEAESLKSKAIDHLSKLAEGETKSGNTGALISITKLIEQLEGMPSLLVGGESDVELAEKVTGKVVIKANKPTEIGSYLKGERISLSYSEGKWGMSGDQADPLKWVSPNTTKEGSPHCLAIFSADGEKPQLLAVVPPDTGRRTFRYKFEANCANVILRMKDTVIGDNHGHVVYEVD